jgi:hypothetical protein
MSTEEMLPNNNKEEPTVLETNSIVRFLWNILFACFYPFLITFSLLVSAVVLTISFIGNIILRIFRR